MIVPNPRPDGEVAYMRRLNTALHGLPQADRTAIINEIGSHIADRLEEGASLETVLERLGSPETLGQSYLEVHELSRALAKGSPGALLASVLGRGTKSLVALACGAAAAMLYFLGIMFTSLAVIKPVASAHVGLWIGPGRRILGVVIHAPSGSREILGYWIIPLSAIAAVVCYVIGTELLKFCGRLLLRRSGHARRI